MLLALCVAVFLGLPLLVSLRHWRTGRRLSAVSWLIACIAGPALAFWAALQVLEPRLPPQRSSGDAVDMVIDAGLVALGVWLALCGLAWLSCGRVRAKSDAARGGLAKERDP